MSYEGSIGNPPAAQARRPADRFALARMSRRAAAHQSALLAALAAAEQAVAADARLVHFVPRLAQLTRRDIRAGL